VGTKTTDNTLAGDDDDDIDADYQYITYGYDLTTPKLKYWSI